MPETWFILKSGCSSAALNMGWDEALLDDSAVLNRPVLRFYGWTEPAASFGYFQKHAAIRSWTPLRPLVRRPTGGGLVAHDADWTYSLVFPPCHGWYAFRAQESYQRLHAWIQRSFARLKIETELAPAPLKAAPGRCFAGPERHDLLWDGRKVAGAAQRRSRQGLLIQGSVQQHPPRLQRKTWETALIETAEFGGPVVWEELRPKADLEVRAAYLAETKYSDPTYTERR